MQSPVFIIVVIKLLSPNKVSLVSDGAEKAMTMNFPTSMPVSFRVFRVQEVSPLSHLANVYGLSAFPVFFTHWTQHTVVYLNKATGCLAHRGIPWLPPLSAIRVITILLKTVNKRTFLYRQQVATELRISGAQHKAHSAESNTSRTLHDFKAHGCNDLHNGDWCWSPLFMHQ